MQSLVNCVANWFIQQPDDILHIPNNITFPYFSRCLNLTHQYRETQRSTLLGSKWVTPESIRPALLGVRCTGFNTPNVSRIKLPCLPCLSIFLNNPQLSFSVMGNSVDQFASEIHVFNCTVKNWDWSTPPFRDPFPGPSVNPLHVQPKMLKRHLRNNQVKSP